MSIPHNMHWLDTAELDIYTLSISKLDGCIVWNAHNAVIQYLAESGQLSVHKLFTACIRRCLVSRSCD